MTGHPIFERWARVQGNTVEQLVIFFPGLWMFSTYVRPDVAAALGVVFLVGRALFARGYVADPARRGPGFVLSYLSNAVLVARRPDRGDRRLRSDRRPRGGRARRTLESFQPDCDRFRRPPPLYGL